MTAAQLIQQIRQVTSYNLDSYLGADASDDDILAVLNETTQDVGRFMALRDPKVSFTPIEGENIYSVESPAFGRRLSTVSYVIVNNLELMSYAGTPGGVWNIDEAEDYYPQWRTATNGVPGFVAFDGERLIFSCPFSAASVTAGNCWVSGEVMPRLMSGDLDQVSPDLPFDVHSALADLTIVSLTSGTCTERSQFDTVAMLEARANAKIAAVKRRISASRNKVGYPGRLTDRLIMV